MVSCVEKLNIITGYQWSLAKHTATEKVTETVKKETSNTDLMRLCRYYLSCIIVDDDGLSTFLKSEFSVDYVELDKLPEPEDDLSTLDGFASLKGKKDLIEVGLKFSLESNVL